MITWAFLFQSSCLVNNYPGHGGFHRPLPHGAGVLLKEVISLFLAAGDAFQKKICLGKRGDRSNAGKSPTIF
jgi:hypothetical protein